MFPKAFASFESELNKAEGQAVGKGAVLPSYTDVGGIISELLKYAFPFVGLALFVFLAMGGFDLMLSGGDPKKIEQGKEKITASIVGFLIFFAAFWIYQIISFVLGIQL